ncbi:non-hydrolyzing UDP-N-acetylglucosamine 2-epimerase [Compostimonas suwonensis]|uniref:UDP-N-acetylglucosamine 2-epimerase (non-hydrolyzing) n=1 Tax=Compostimonas suwonensis TaxID=1048394 RepID=A0A2M9BUA3_9MICO|nr:UDP-N-acetylglucosamine 2-epimerase (non-hydrolyzing) [Compostimonas suwonensis]PJJ61529.1 UDP-N-acetylglucosamine 2-epimerase (non-hydrolysing) [Compostimonas suwonensis]
MPIYGTRPEAIKFAPVVRDLLRADDIDTIVTVTGQHRSMLDQVNGLFGIVPDFDLDIITPKQSLGAIAARVFDGLAEVFAASRPDAVMVQGDTSTSTIAALAAFYEGIPVVHLEAGLRSGDLASPFPEEGNRKVTGQIASLHLAPTPGARSNLLREGVDPSTIVVTGNTVIDALLHVVSLNTPLEHPQLAALAERTGPLLVVTSHRRESWGEGVASTARALERLAERHPELTIVLPLHRNPVVRDALSATLSSRERVILTDPLDYAQFTTLLAHADIVLTDSGGVQEEAPSLGKPVLVTRDTTERPEAVDAGTVRLVGTGEDTIVAEVSRLLDDRGAYEAMSRSVNPYGDGRASERTLAAVRAFFGLGTRLEDFGTV